MSEAIHALDQEQLNRWDWRATSILWISYEWDPVRGGPEALAGRRLAARLVHAGARVHVLTAVGADEQHRCHGYEVTVIPATPIANNKLVRAVQMVRSGIPEPSCLWVRSAVQIGARVLSTLPADTIVYGRAMPGSSNIVAWHLAKLTGLPWVAHFSDEWPPVQALSSRRGWRAPYKPPLFAMWRRRLFRDAGALTFTNPRQASAVLGTSAARHLSKAFVVTHLPMESTRRRLPQQYELFHLVHTGNLNPPGHTSAALIQGLRMFLDRTPTARGRVRFTQAGWQNGDVPEWTARCALDDVVRLVGRLTQEEVAELLESASLLTGFDYARSDSTTLLSKLPDYIISGRPILIITARSSAMGRLFHEDEAGLTAHYDSPEEVADRIGDVYRAWRQRRSDAFQPQAAAIESFTQRRVLAELAGAFTVARAAVTKQAINLPSSCPD